MKTSTLIILLALLPIASAMGAEQQPGEQQQSIVDSRKDKAPEPGWQYSKEELGIGRKHTGNAWCNRQIDKILEGTWACLNTHPASECEELRKKNSKKMGGYLRSPRCIK